MAGIAQYAQNRISYFEDAIGLIRFISELSYSSIQYPYEIGPANIEFQLYPPDVPKKCCFQQPHWPVSN